MILHELAISGPRIVEPERHEDDRGFFARTFSEVEFAAAGLESAVVECSISFNEERGTLRGMHLQRAPHGECKLVRCTRGRIWDVAVDVRSTSESFGKWVAAELTADSGRAIYLPVGFAHGFITLEPGSEVFYQTSHVYCPGAASGFRWDDASVSISWPIAPTVISEADGRLPTLNILRRTLEADR